MRAGREVRNDISFKLMSLHTYYTGKPTVAASECGELQHLSSAETDVNAYLFGMHSRHSKFPHVSPNEVETYLLGMQRHQFHVTQTSLSRLN